MLLRFVFHQVISCIKRKDAKMNYIFYKEQDGKVVATEIVPEEDIKRVADAAQDVRRVYRVEEIFHMIMSALLEFNSEIFQAADLSRIAVDNVVENELLRIRINQCVATFLTTLDLYHEYMYLDKGHLRFSISADKFNDNRFTICKAVRNYIQHIATIGINIKWGGSLCACGEKLCSFSVSADASEIRRNMDKLHEPSRNALNEFIERKTEINLYEIFNGVVDVLFDIQKDVRASKEYAVEYKDSAMFLEELHERLRAKGLFWYRYEGDDEAVCRGETPYFYERQREMISFLSQRYIGRQTVDKYYAATAPLEMIHRMAEADRIVATYVKNNGVVAEFDKGASRITDSRFTTKKMRDWYLQERQAGTGPAKPL